MGLAGGAKVASPGLIPSSLDDPGARSCDRPLVRRNQLPSARSGDPPTYRVIEEHGRSHARAFLVIAEAGGRDFPSAWGRTLKEAERWAAHEALLELTEDEGE